MFPPKLKSVLLCSNEFINSCDIIFWLSMNNNSNQFNWHVLYQIKSNFNLHIRLSNDSQLREAEGIFSVYLTNVTYEEYRPPCWREFLSL